MVLGCIHVELLRTIYLLGVHDSVHKRRRLSSDYESALHQD